MGFSVNEALRILDAGVTATKTAPVAEGTHGKIADLRRTKNEGYIIRVDWQTGVSDWLTKRESESQLIF